MAPRETENNAYAKFWGDKQRTLWYVMVFLEWSIIPASYPDVSLLRAKEGGSSVPFPWSLEAHHQSLASTLRKTKRLRR